MRKDDPSEFTNCLDAANEIVNVFMAENIASPEEAAIRAELTPKVVAALEMDRRLPNRYQVLALNGCVPEDGSWPDDDSPKDYGCPPEVSALFPNTDSVISDQF